MKKELIISATDKLELLNISLHESQFDRNPGYDPLIYPNEITPQTLLAIDSEVIEYETENDKLNILRVYASAGIRAALSSTNETDSKDTSDTDDDPDVLFTIEATYRIDYSISGKLSEEEILEFRNFNAVHNMWPFWRQHVFQITKSGDLPMLNVPLMRGTDTKNKQPKKRQPKKKQSKK